jgi:hypothetical protein
MLADIAVTLQIASSFLYAVFADHAALGRKNYVFRGLKCSTSFS